MEHHAHRGPSVVKWVREGLASRIPILFVTNRSDEADMVAGLAAGADHFMVKPIRVAELEARVRACCGAPIPASTKWSCISALTTSFRSRALCRWMAKPSTSGTASTNWRCSCSRTWGTCCRASICAKRSANAARTSPRARSTPTSRACAPSCRCARPTASCCRRDMGYGLGYRLEAVEVASLASFGSNNGNVWARHHEARPLPGLLLVRAAVQRHGGSVEIESAENQGCTVILVLP